MEKHIPVKIMIHDLNPWGGQDRSVLEIAWALNKYHPLEIHSYTLEGYKNWPNMKHIKYDAFIKKPILFKFLDYQLKSYNTTNLDHTTQLIQSTGTASLRSHVIQVQFVHKTWQKIAESLPAENSSEVSILKRIYKNLLDFYKVQTEITLYTKNKYYVAISHGIKKELIEHYQIPAHKIQVIHHGVNAQYFKPYKNNPEAERIRKDIRQNLLIDENDIVLLHVGALNARKGLFQTFKLLSYFKKNGFKNIKYIAVGQGENSMIHRLIKSENVEDMVKIVPHSKDIRNYYWASDIFYFPTYYEPFGLVTLEAMASGLPTFVSQTAGSAEIITDGIDGLLFNPKDTLEKIAHKLTPYIKDKKLREQLAHSGHQKAQNYDWDQVGIKYSEFYQKISQDKGTEKKLQE